MDNDDDLVFLNQEEDEEFSVYGAQVENFNEDGSHTGLDMDLETTIRVTINTRPYWQRMFG